MGLAKSRSWKGQYIFRYQRFEAESSSIQLIAKNRTSRFNCFWMTVKDISKTGIGAYYIGRGMIPVRMSDSLSITLDVTCKVFDRPLHLNCQVKRFNFDENWQGEKGLNRFFLGLHIEEIQSRHEQYWLEGLRKYGDPEKMD